MQVRFNPSPRFASRILPVKPDEAAQFEREISEHLGKQQPAPSPFSIEIHNNLRFITINVENTPQEQAVYNHMQSMPGVQVIDGRLIYRDCNVYVEAPRSLHLH